VHDSKVTKHFESMTKASDALFDGKLEKWPIFESNLIREAENPTIGWRKDILSFKVLGQDP
jgi:hypothetical protein